MPENWSKRIEDTYQLRLPDDLVAWFDEGVWEEEAGREFRYPLTPQQLLEPTREWIWPGFMLPNTLPLIGNQYGDWLCLRANWSNEVAEVVYWCHGGGDWIPYGNSLAEALLYDAAFQRIYKDRLPETDPNERQLVMRSANWAQNWLEGGQSIEPFWGEGGVATPTSELLETLVDRKIGEVAARRDLILMHLETPLRQKASPKIAAEMGTSWEPDFVSWMFDAGLIPELRKADLTHYLKITVQELNEQNWADAEDHAKQVINLRSDLGWPFDIVGWSNERRGEVQTAIEHYKFGVRSSSFSDETVRFRTHWFPEGLGKFAAARLLELRGDLASEDLQDGYLQLWWENDPESIRSRVRDYWVVQAESQESAQNAYRCFFQAGWDLGLQFQHSYQDILDNLIQTARSGGAEALARIAETHRKLLDQ